jgi:hypothetical protein
MDHNDNDNDNDNNENVIIVNDESSSNDNNSSNNNNNNNNNPSSRRRQRTITRRENNPTTTSSRSRSRSSSTFMVWTPSNSSSIGKNEYYVLFALVSLIICWIICFFLLVIRGGGGDIISMTTKTTTTSLSSSMLGVHDVVDRYRSSVLQENNKSVITTNNNNKYHSQSSHLVSRLLPNNKVIATSDVRGNLGPISVIIQSNPGNDWIHDRWQAASNMHGKNIPGEHWIQLDFSEHSNIIVDKIVLDWETAYADEYIIEGSLEPIVDGLSSTSSTDNNNKISPDSKIWTLFDGRKKASSSNTNTNNNTSRSVSESGLSPGVDEKRPLHIVHDIRLLDDEAKNKPIRYLRLHILKGGTPWGVSLWQFDVYGFRTDELQTI